MLFQRVVIDVEIDPGGRLRPRPGAAWRPEPARGEATIHRRLAALAEATDARIGAFASVHGFLRIRGAAVLGGPGAESVAATIAIGQEALDHGERVREWFEAGAVGPPPVGTEDTVLALELLAAVPDWVIDAIEPKTEVDGGAPPTPTDPAQFFRVVLPVVAATRRAVEHYGFNPDRFRQLDPDGVRRAFRLNEWVNRVVGGLDETPEPLAAVGGSDGLIRQLVAAVPELFAVPEHGPPQDMAVAAYLEAMATETVADWRAAALEHRHRVQSIDLIGRALRPAGISSADKRELAALHAELAGYRSSVELAAAEVAERPRPLLAATLEAKIAELGAWPVRRGALAGVHVRSFVAAWAELTASTPLVACGSPGCTGSFSPTRNRRYCAECQLARRRAAVWRTRSRAGAR